MDPNRLYQAAAIVRGTALRIWENPNEEPSLFQVWRDRDWCGDGGQLTETGRRVTEQADMLRYALRVSRDLAEETWPHTHPENYALLRRALGWQARTLYVPWIQDLARDLLRNFQEIQVLDYGGGDGSLLESVLNYILGTTSTRKVQGALMDREPEGSFPDHIVCIASDFRVNPGWYRDYHLEGTCQAVLMSELVHCVHPREEPYLFRSAREMLVPGGYLMIIEQLPSSLTTWRLDLLTSGRGRTVPRSQIFQHGVEHGLQVVRTDKIAESYMTLFRRN